MQQELGIEDRLCMYQRVLDGGTVLDDDVPVYWAAAERVLDVPIYSPDVLVSLAYFLIYPRTIKPMI